MAHQLENRFRAAMDVLGLSASDLSAEMGVSVQTIRQSRLDPARPSYRPPPVGWREALAQIARDRIPELVDLVAELTEPGA